MLRLCRCLRRVSGGGEAVLAREDKGSWCYWGVGKVKQRKRLSANCTRKGLNTMGGRAAAKT